MSHHNRMQFIAVPAVAAAIWLQLLLMALCCCSSFITAQQLHIANPYKYQQLQYQKLQHQQQQYEYQKQIQQLYLQQQIKLQQQKQQQQQLQQQLLAEQEEKAAMQKLLEQQEQEKFVQQQQQLQEKLLQQQMQKELLQKQQQQEQELLRQQQIIQQQQQQQHVTYSLPIQTPQSPLQHYEQQLQQSQQHATYPVSVSLTQQQQQHFPLQSSALPTQSQMLQTSASLIVDDECDEEEDSSEIVQKESTEYRINITPETIIQAAQPPTRRHPEAISMTDTQQQTDSDYNVVASSIAPSTETFDFWRGFVEDEVTAPVAPTAIAETVPTAAAATAIAPTAKATAPTSTATAEVARPIAKKRTTTTAKAPTALTSTATAALTSSVSTAYDATAPAFTSSAAALTATATAAASLAAVIPRSTAAATGTARQRKDTRPKTGKRRRKPAAVREPLAALEKEQKLYELRDRQRQEFVAEVTSAYRDKSYRRPYSQSKKPDESQESSSSGNSTVSAKKSVELKNILKKSGGMSLSEILQQKNLSLDDLLKGKQTALLALQTTSATATQQNPTPVRKLKPQRRVVPTAHTAGTSSTTLSASAETFSGSGESESNEQKPFGKNKLKFPALQRLKLFGTSSRGGEAAGSKRREAINSTMARSTSTTTTTTSTTTKRVPIYRKRQQLLQRTTLKPLGGLLKASTSTAETVTQAPTPVAAIKILPPTAMETREIAEEEEEIDRTTEVEEETLPTTTASSTTSSTTTPIPPAKSTSTISSRRTSTSTTTMATNSQTRAANIINRTQTNTVPSNTKSHTQTKYALDITNPQTNSIEHEDDTLPPSGKSAESLETAVTYADDDLEDFFEEATTKRNANNNSTTSSSTTTFPNSLVERLTPRSDRYPVKPTGDYDNLPYVDPVDDRTDLLELIEDRRSGNRLFKVLEQRNMTLEELIEHRKRGSSQLHLAMVVQNRSRFFPDKKVILRDNMDIVTAFENFPHFNLMNLKSVKPDEIKTDSQGSSYFTSIIDIEPTDEIYRDEKKGAVSSVEKSSSSESDSVKGALSRNRLERRLRQRGKARYRNALRRSSTV